MSEDAKFYQEHKDDPEVWEDVPVPVRSERRRLDALVSVRFASDEEAALREVARGEGMTLSALIREAALRCIGPDLELGEVVIENGYEFSQAGGTTGTSSGDPSFNVGGSQIAGGGVQHNIESYADAS